MSYRNYKPTGNSFTHAPENNQLCIETSAAIYYVSADDNKQLWKYTIATGSDAQVDVDPLNIYGGDNKSRKKNIFNAWHNRSENKIYFTDSNQDATTVYFWWLDITDDSVTEIGNIPAVNRLTMHDYIYFSGAMCLIYTKENVPINTHIYIVVSGNGLGVGDMGDGAGRTYDVSYVVPDPNDSDLFYFLWKWNDENVEIWKYDKDTDIYTELEDCGANTDLSSDPNLKGIAHDGSDVLYFILDVSGTNYLYTYRISTDTLTKKAEYNIALMLDRNTASGVLEKAFHLTKPRIYQIASNYEYLYNIAILNTAKTIKAITDNYVILE